MKREKFLWPLTQSHHRALVAAKHVREVLGNGFEEALEKASEEIRRLYEVELRQHFLDEEEMMALFEREVGPEDPDALRLRQDHRLLESLIPQKTRESLLLFAETITAHVRFEEDILFGRVEKTLSEREKKETGEHLIHPPSC